jgi:hypothetical protein
MRRTGMAVVGLGWRSLLALVGGAASFVGVGSGTGCGFAPPPYGMQPVYGVQVSCTQNFDCTSRFNADWYCINGTCDVTVKDGGTPDSGK